MRVPTSAIAAAASAGFSLVLVMEGVDGFSTKTSLLPGRTATLSRARRHSMPVVSVATQPETEEDLREKLAERNEDLSEVRLVTWGVCAYMTRMMRQLYS